MRFQLESAAEENQGLRGSRGSHQGRGDARACLPKLDEEALQLPYGEDLGDAARDVVHNGDAR